MKYKILPIVIAIVQLFIIFNAPVGFATPSGWLPDFQLTHGGVDAATPITVVNHDESKVNVVWSDRRDGNYEIYFNYSTDKGMSWSTDAMLSHSQSYAWFPAISVLDQRVSVVWSDYRFGNWEIYFLQSSNGGASWGSEQRLTANGSISTTPSIAIDSTGIYVVWCDSDSDGIYKIYFIRSTNGGSTWSTETTLINSSGDTRFPHILANNSVLHLIWEDWRSGNAEIYYSRSTNSGVSWSSGVPLSPLDDIASSYPSVAVKGTNLYVVWDDIRYGSSEIFIRRSLDNGINWQPETEVTQQDGYDSWLPNIAATDSTVQVFWQDDRDGNAEIFYSPSPLTTSSGIRFTSTDTVDSILLSAMSGGKHTFVTWMDKRTGIDEIFFSTDAFVAPTAVKYWQRY